MPIRRSFTWKAALLLFFVLAAPLPSARAEAVRIVVEGVSGELRENVEAALALPPGLVRDAEVDRRWLERFQRQIPQNVRTALEPFGYYDPQISVTAGEGGDGELGLRVLIDPGTPVRVRRVRVEIRGEGADSPALRDLARAFPLRTGDVLRHDLYDQSKGTLHATAIDLGYLQAGFAEQRIQVRRTEGSAEIDLVLDTGPLHYFGEVQIEGAEEYPEKFLRRYLAFSPGETFSYGKLGRTQYNFFDSDRFQQVVVSPHLEEVQGFRVPVTVTLKPSLPKRLRPGIGYATDTGPRITLHYQDVNVFHRGHELESEILLAQIKQSVGAGYIVPSRRSIESHTAFRVGFDGEEIDDNERRTLFAEVERRRTLGKGRTGSVYLRVFREDYTSGDTSTVSYHVMPGVRFSLRRYPDVVRPDRGYSFSLESRGSSKMLGSDTSLLQFLGSANALFPLPARFTLLLRAQGGVTVQDVSLSEVPLSLRFFAGGDQSVRGYGFQRLGEVDETGSVIGGKNLLVGSIELERALGENWGVAVFYDTGNAFNAFSTMDLKQGAGIGVRRYTPVGPVKIDIARQIGVSDPSFRLHLSIGFTW